MMKKIALLGTAFALTVAGTTPVMAQFSSAMDVSKSTAREARASQQTIENLDDQARNALGDFIAMRRQHELLVGYNRTRQGEVERQRETMEGLKRDLESVEDLQRAMQPLMEEMVDTLEKFIAADAPFYAEERAERITRLRDILSDSNYKAAQRYRLILEAYQIEMDFGTSMDSYEAEVQTDTEVLAVEFLRIGRVTLIYKTKDDSIMRIWDKDAGDFVDMSKSDLDNVRYVFRMAKEQTAPAIFSVPVENPTDLTAQ